MLRRRPIATLFPYTTLFRSYSWTKGVLTMRHSTRILFLLAVTIGLLSSLASASKAASTMTVEDSSWEGESISRATRYANILYLAFRNHETFQSPSSVSFGNI